MKIAPLVRAFDVAGLSWRLIHTGQHYDQKMSGSFFEELGIPEPHVNLGVGSGSHVKQTAEVMLRLESEFQTHRPRAVVVVGDVNSTLAAALTANKLEIPVAHVEAGLRSFDRGMPEEINRILTDAISDWLFTSEPVAAENLVREGIDPARIVAMGNVMIDTQKHHLEAARAERSLEKYQVQPEAYAVLTLHRPSNVDDRKRLASILAAVQAVCRRFPVVFPVHPRTRARLEEGRFMKDIPEACKLVDPVGYREMLGLVDASRFVMTDSGGLQEEAAALGVPCLTLRENTERPITIDQGSNRLVGWKTQEIVSAVDETLAAPKRSPERPAGWDGLAAERIANHLKTTFLKQ